MPLYQVVVLAIIQALTEFAPVSSSAHLALAPWLFGWKDPGVAFDVALHVGTLAAILIYFFRDWVQIIGQGFGLRAGSDPQLKQNRALLWLLAAGSVPIGVVGFLFGKQAETGWRNPYLIGSMLILVGLVMWIAGRRGAGNKSMSQIGWGDSVIIGIAQSLAVIPGTVAQRHHYHGRTVPWARPRNGRTLFVPAFRAGHRRGGLEKRLGHP